MIIHHNSAVKPITESDFLFWMLYWLLHILWLLALHEFYIQKLYKYQKNFIDYLKYKLPTLQKETYQQISLADQNYSLVLKLKTSHLNVALCYVNHLKTETGPAV